MCRSYSCSVGALQHYDRTTNREFPISTLSLRKNLTAAALSCQSQITMAVVEWHRGSLGSFADLFGPFLASRRWSS